MGYWSQAKVYDDKLIFSNDYITHLQRECACVINVNLHVGLQSSSEMC